ncbi:MAG: hypothetical protein EOO01_38495, partial [Chitinophagaceae bacterium]
MKKALHTIFFLVCIYPASVKAQTLPACSMPNPGTDFAAFQSWQLMDCDKDGILNKNETFDDTDGDGYQNFQDYDSDDDGTLDAYEAFGDGYATKLRNLGNNHANSIYHSSVTDGVLPAWASVTASGVKPRFLDPTDAEYYADADNDGIVDLYDIDAGGTEIMPDASYQNGTSTATPLPVTLINFSARIVSNEVILHWQTASEKDNHYFRVERSVNGKNFSEIGRVTGKGNSATKATYTFSDEHPTAGTAYYRLCQIDFDGRQFFSPVIGAQVSAIDKQEASYSVYPTRFNTEL